MAEGRHQPRHNVIADEVGRDALQPANNLLITSLIDDGVIRPVVDRVFPFAFASREDAMAYVEGGRAKGKVVVSVRES